MFRQEYDLADMRRVVRDLTIDGLQHGMRLAANRDRAHQVFGFERFDRGEDEVPALLPQLHHVGASCCGADFEFRIAKAVRLLTVRCQKIGEARAHVSREMLHQNRDRVRFRIERGEKVGVAKLRHRALAHALVTAHLAPCFVEIVSREISCQGSPSPSPAAPAGCLDRNSFARAQPRAELPRHLFARTIDARDESFP